MTISICVVDPTTLETELTECDPGQFDPVHPIDTPVEDRFCAGVAVESGQVKVILLVVIDAVHAPIVLYAPTTFVELFGNSFASAILTGEEAVSRKSGEAGRELLPPLTNAGALTLVTLPEIVPTRLACGPTCPPDPLA